MHPRTDEELMLAFKGGDTAAYEELFARNGLNLLFWGGLLWLGWRSVRSRVLALVRPTLG